MDKPTAEDFKRVIRELEKPLPLDMIVITSDLLRQTTPTPICVGSDAKEVDDEGEYISDHSPCPESLPSRCKVSREQ